MNYGAILAELNNNTYEMVFVITYEYNGDAWSVEPAILRLGDIVLATWEDNKADH